MIKILKSVAFLKSIKYNLRGVDDMDIFTIKIEYLNEAVRLERIDGDGFENLFENQEISFEALCYSKITPIVFYNGKEVVCEKDFYTVKVVKNGVLTVDAKSLPKGLRHKVGVGLNSENLTEYNPEVFMKPVWEGDTVYHEAVMFADSADGIVQKEKKLLFPIDEIVSVRNNNLDKWYVLGVDFKVENGKLIFIEGGSCPCWKGNFTVSANEEDSYFDPALNVGTSGKAASWYTTVEKGDKGLNLIYDAYHEKCTIYVTYTHSKTWADLGEEGFCPEKPDNQSDRVKYFYEKLASGEEINALVFGASTATGCSSTGMLKNYELFSREPDENGEYQVTLRKETCDGISAVPFFEQATNEMVKRYGNGNKVSFYNIANGGTGAAWGKKNLIPRIEFLNKYYGKKIMPDIIYIKFMGNDARTAPASYLESFDSMVADFKRLYPNALIVMVSGKINNERTYIYRNYRQNYFELQEVLSEVSNKYDNCVVAKTTPFWVNALNSKNYEDYLSNNINHANDFWAKTTAQIIVATIEK